MNDTYKEIEAILKAGGHGESMSFGTETVTDKILYIGLYCPVILMYSKELSIKKLLSAYDVNVSCNSNIECIIIKLIE